MSSAMVAICASLSSTVYFTVEEINLMCVFEAKGRTELIEDIGRVLPHLDEKDMEELANRVIGKLQNMTDEEFAEVVLEAAE